MAIVQVHIDTQFHEDRMNMAKGDPSDKTCFGKS